MKNINTLLHTRWIVPIVPRDQILENHSIAIDQGKIIDILPTEIAKKNYTAKHNINRHSHAVMPGLVNTHTHAAMTLFRGIADDLELMDWLNNHIWPAEAKIINAESVYDGTRLAAAEMIRGGTTCFNDHYFFPNDVARAVIESGMRASIGHVIMNVPNKWAKNEDEYISKAKAAYAERSDNPLLTWTIAPQGPYTNSDRSLTLAKKLADEYKLRMHMHVHETQAELDIDLKNHGKRPMKRLHDLGLLDEKFIAVHMVYLTDEEIELCRKTKLHIVHNPECNLKLASGFAPILKLEKAGVNVCLGTDGAASNNSLDMFSEIHMAALVAKGISGDSTTLNAMSALEMGTINGAKALGLEKEIGSIEIGKQADIITIDLDHFFTQPMYSPISHLVYAVNRMQVSDVFIAGKQLLNRGEFTEIDTQEIVARAKVWAARI